MRQVLEERVRRLERWNPPKTPIICWRDWDGYTVEGRRMSEEEFQTWAEKVPKRYEVIVIGWSWRSS